MAWTLQELHPRRQREAELRLNIERRQLGLSRIRITPDGWIEKA